MALSARLVPPPHLCLPLRLDGRRGVFFLSFRSPLPVLQRRPLFLFRFISFDDENPNQPASSASPRLSRRAIFLRLRLLMFIKILFDQRVPFRTQGSSLGGCYRTEGALKQHGELLTCLFFCMPPAPHPPARLPACLATATTNTNGCNSDAFSKVSHTCKMDQ